jgi:hypothetical protein
MSIDFSPSILALNRNRLKDRTQTPKETIGKKVIDAALHYEAFMTKHASTKSELAHAAFRGDIPSEVTSVLEQNGALEKGWRTRETS